MKNAAFCILACFLLFVGCSKHSSQKSLVKKTPTATTISYADTASKNAATPSVKDSIIRPINDSLKYIPILKSASQKREWKNEWNVDIANAIDSFGTILLNADSLPIKDINRLCTNFKDLSPEKKKIFWALVFASIAKFESDFDTACRFREPASLNHIYSEGLLQLSYGDEKNYKNCPIDSSKHNILNPKINLTSGVIILSKQIRTRKTLFTTKHFYWSVLTNKQNEIVAFFKKCAEGSKFCE
jgi:hypothetical protein